MKATTKGRPCFNDIKEDECKKIEIRTMNCTIGKARVIRKLNVLTGVTINPVMSSNEGR